MISTPYNVYVIGVAMNAQQLANLSGNALQMGFITHFKPWALTPECMVLLNKLATAVVEAEYEEDQLMIHFEDEHTIIFGMPYQGDFLDDPFVVPESYKTVVQLHNFVMFDDGVPEGIDLYISQDGEPISEFMIEELGGDLQKHQGFCDAGQNWIIWDHSRKNSLGEPMMVLVDHNMVVDQNDDFPEQDQCPFGVGGLLIRLMMHLIFEDTKYGWG